MRQRLTPAAFNRASLLAEPFTPQSAVEAGFLDRVVDAEELPTVALGIARSLTALDLAAHAATKRRVRESTLDAIARANEADIAAGGLL